MKTLYTYLTKILSNIFDIIRGKGVATTGFREGNAPPWLGAWVQRDHARQSAAAIYIGVEITKRLYPVTRV